jgi:hypothetical protein
VSHGSIAAFRESAGRAVSSESDIGNITAGLGLVPGLTLTALMISGFVTAVRMHLRRPSARHLAILGMATVVFGQWTTGGLYCTSVLLWVLLGGLTREWHSPPSRTDDAPPTRLA